jgi:glycerophosphoryl diester phosphodiesterase
MAMRRSPPEHDRSPCRGHARASRDLRLWGHRGASAECAENSLRAFERALERGANALELDVHLTVDREVVVIHDPTGERVAGVALPVARTSLRQLKRWSLRAPDGAADAIPTLDEVLALRPEVPVSVDIKPRDLSTVASVLSVVRRHHAEQRVTIASFHWPTLRAVRRAGYRGPTALSQIEVLRLAVTPTLAQRVVPPRGAAAQVPVRAGPLYFGSRWFIAKCHRLGLRVDFWTINDPAEAGRLLALGADGIMTDDIPRLRPVFEARSARAASPTAQPKSTTTASAATASESAAATSTIASSHPGTRDDPTPGS